MSEAVGDPFTSKLHSHIVSISLDMHHHLVVLVGSRIHPDVIVAAPLRWKQRPGICTEADMKRMGIISDSTGSTVRQ